MKIAVIRFSALGDLAMLLPLVNQIAQHKSEDVFTVVTQKKYISIADSFPELSVIGVDLSQYTGLMGLKKLASDLTLSSYDRIIDAHNVTRSQVITRIADPFHSKTTVLNKMRASRTSIIKDKHAGPAPHIVESMVHCFKKAGFQFEHPETSYTRSPRLHKTIAIAPGAAHHTKRYPIRSWMELSNLLAKDGYQFQVYGGEEDLSSFHALKAANPNAIFHDMITGLGIREQIENMKNCDLMIAMDSSNGHLAGIAEIPICTIWGSTHRKLGYGTFVPETHRLDIEVPISELNCRPCSRFGQKPCHRGDHACMELLSPETVYKHVKQYLDDYEPSS